MKKVIRNDIIDHSIRATEAGQPPEWWIPEFCDKCGKLLTDDGYRCPSCGDLLCPICLQHLNEYGECPACDEYEGSARG